MNHRTHNYKAVLLKHFRIHFHLTLKTASWNEPRNIQAKGISSITQLPSDLPFREVETSVLMPSPILFPSNHVPSLLRIWTNSIEQEKLNLSCFFKQKNKINRPSKEAHFIIPLSYLTHGTAHCPKEAPPCLRKNRVLVIRGDQARAAQPLTRYV